MCKLERVKSERVVRTRESWWLPYLMTASLSVQTPLSRFAIVVNSRMVLSDG